MAPRTPSKHNQRASTPTKSYLSQFKTPQSKHRLNFNAAKPSPNPNSAVKEALPSEHPVEVIGRIRDYHERKDKPISALQINTDRQSLRIRTDIGYRDFSLDGVSISEEEDLDVFYKKFVESRINDVRLGAKCTIMMYGPTGSGKSHTMFGCEKQPGIVYKSLRDILGRGDEENDGNEQQAGTFVQITVLEIYNEEIFDLLSSNNGGGFNPGWTKGSTSKVKLEVMGKKAKNATFICGTEAGKISKEIQKVEKRRIVKSTLCNERSSRSHCMIILDVPTVGGRLMMVDMAGSENIEQAGQTGPEAKLQTGKINQGNIALKRVVESIANGDSHVPFRDSKLTMLLQDSFEDDKSKILMILCASPDPKELHKTLSTLEYGSKAKCIVRGPYTPMKDDKGTEDSSSSVILGSKIAAMDQFIYKLQMENKLKEKERNEANKALMEKEEEISSLKVKLALEEGKRSETNEEEINLKVNERTQMIKSELEKKIQECKKIADDFVDKEKRKMEERMLQQQQEVEILRRRLEEIEYELHISGNTNGLAVDGSSFAKRLLEMYAVEDPEMEKSMDLDRSMDFDIHKTNNSNTQVMLCYPNVSSTDGENSKALLTKFSSTACLSTVFEEEEEEHDKEKPEDQEVQKEVIEEKRVCSSRPTGGVSMSGVDFNTLPLASSTGFAIDVDFPKQNPEEVSYSRERKVERNFGTKLTSESENGRAASSMQVRLQNIFTLCGNERELKKFQYTDSVSKLRTIEETPQGHLQENALALKSSENQQKWGEEEKVSTGHLLQETMLATKKTPENKKHELGENQMNTKARRSDGMMRNEEKENFGSLMLLS